MVDVMKNVKLRKNLAKRGEVGEVLQIEEKLLFIMRGSCILPNAFPAPLEMMRFPPCILLMWCNTLTDFHVCKHFAKG